MLYKLPSPKHRDVKCLIFAPHKLSRTCRKRYGEKNTLYTKEPVPQAGPASWYHLNRHASAANKPLLPSIFFYTLISKHRYREVNDREIASRNEQPLA